uniref:Methyltransferase domain-containing protein n=1 Tax=Lygus hesperus TaxID=30085 RepID=A0A0K8S8Y3_LYGHE
MAEGSCRMNNAGLYVRFNAMQAKDADEAMEEFSSYFKWGKAEKILDVGSGPGDVTSTILRSYVPDDASLIGSDISREMVDYATAKFKSDRIMFRILDIENVPWETEMENSYHKIFSFYCFHWIQNQKLAVENMSKLLKPDGQQFLVFLAKSPIFDLYKNLKINPTWAPFMQDIDNYISKYHNSLDPAEEFKQLLINNGFSDVKAINRWKSYYFDSVEQLITSIIAVNPFIKRIPEDLLPSYREDIDKFIHQTTTQKDGRIQINYCLIVAYAVK